MRNQYQILVNDEPLDLSDNTVIAVSLQSFLIGEFTSRYANYTNSISIPFTDNNNRIFGYANNINSSSRVQYAANDVRLLINGIEIINAGYIIIIEVTNVYKIAIYSGLLGFSASIGDKMLYELSNTNADSAILTTPTINDNVTETYNNNGYPASDYPTIIEAILTEGGYTYSGDVFSANDYQRMAIYMSLPTSEYQDNFRGEKKFNAAINTALPSLSPSGTYQILSFDTTNYNGANNWWNGSRWTLDTVDYDFNYSIYLDVLVSVSGGSGTVRVATLEIGGEVQYQDISTGTSNVRIRLSAGGYYTPASDPYPTYLEVGYKHQTGSGATLTVTSATIYGTVTKGFGSVTTYRQNRYTLPIMKQMDLLTDFIVRFGLIPVEKNNHITFKNIQSILLDRTNAVNWTSKRVNKDNQSVVFSSSIYGQQNEFKYTSFDNIAVKEEGDYVAEIDNPYLPLKKTVYTSPFGHTATTLIDYSGGGDYINMAHVPIWDNPEYNDPGFRLVMLRDRYTDEAGTGKVAYFNEPREPYQMTWEYFVTTYYQLLFDSLDNVKTVTYEYLLTETDIANFDPSLLVFDDGNYYAFPEIKNYIPGKITKVTMLKI